MESEKNGSVLILSTRLFHQAYTTPLVWEQGWRSGESARLPPLWPRFDSQYRRHMWVEFVVGSRPCSEGFSSGSPVFLPPQKPTLQIPTRFGNEGHRFVSFAVSVTLTK